MNGKITVIRAALLRPLARIHPSVYRSTHFIADKRSKGILPSLRRIAA